MAFLGRGGLPLGGIIGGISGGNQNNNAGGNGFHRGYWYYRRVLTVVPLDNTYVILQMIATFIILIVGLIAYLATYKSTIVDPIENIKNSFINIHLITIGILLGITLIVNFFPKSAKSMVKRLTIIGLISIISMIVFWGIKINLDTTYTKDAFEDMYIQENGNESSNNKSKIDIGLTGVSIKTEKEYYIDECMKLYNIFKAKAYGTLGIHLLLNILLIYQVLRLSKIEEKKDKISKGDAALFDDEENVKY